MTQLRFNLTIIWKTLALLGVVLLSAAIWGCNSTQNSEPTIEISPLPTNTATPSPTVTRTATSTSSKTPSPTSSFTPVPTKTLTPSITPSPTPKLALLKVHRAAIMSGPGYEYNVLAEYYPGLDLEIIGRNETGNWFVMTLPGGQGWIETEYVEFSFEANSLSIFDTPPTPVPTETPLPAPKITCAHWEVENKRIGCKFILSNLQPNEPVTFEVMSLDGKFYKAFSGTANVNGVYKYVTMSFRTMPSGDYQTILTGDFGSFAMGSFSVP